VNYHYICIVTRDVLRRQTRFGLRVPTTIHLSFYLTEKGKWRRYNGNLPSDALRFCSGISEGMPIVMRHPGYKAHWICDNCFGDVTVEGGSKVVGHHPVC
jgi:hypothetical protein